MRAMAALSLAPRALYEEVAELLRQRIFTRELAPGSWIDELKIAEAYGALLARDSILCQRHMQEHFKNGLEAAN